MNKDLISIVIPVYNAEKYIDETIKSIIDQTYQNWELLLVDDCSKDKSKEIISKYTKIDHRIRYYLQEKNGGPALARNRGIAEAKGEFICFLDADDLWVKDKLEIQYKFMKDNKYAFSFTGYEFANGEGIPNGKRVIVPEKISYKQALKNTTISTCGVMFNMNILTKEDIYMPNVKSEDTACWWKVLKKVEFAYGIPKVMFYYRRNSGTLSANKFEAIKRIWYLYRKVEKINIISSTYYFICYMFNAVKRRI